MIRIIYLLVVVCLIACKNEVIERIESTYPDNSKKKVCYFQVQDGMEVKVEEKHFHQDGKLKLFGKYLNGQREGEWRAYFDNDQLHSVGQFKDGLREGMAKVYFPNGQLRYEGQYKQNKEIGSWKFYNEQGKLKEEKQF